jgi:hypothetical protein
MQYPLFFRIDNGLAVIKTRGTESGEAIVSWLEIGKRLSFFTMQAGFFAHDV